MEMFLFKFQNEIYNKKTNLREMLTNISLYVYTINLLKKILH